MSRKYDNYIDYLNNTIRIPEEQPYLAIDMFAGCGGLSLGFEAAGVKTIGYEMVEDCCNSYEKNLRSVCHKEKITTETEFPKVDIVIGGPPCQPFSRRGKQTGKDDERNGFPAFIEAIRRIKPKIWMCENVKGLPEQNKEYFESIMEQFKELGYEVEYRVFQLVRFEINERSRNIPYPAFCFAD